MDDIRLENKVDKILDEVSQIKVDVKGLSVNSEFCSGRFDDYDKRLDELEKRPVKRWETMMSAVIAAVISWIMVTFTNN